MNLIKRNNIKINFALKSSGSKIMTLEKENKQINTKTSMTTSTEAQLKIL